MCTLGRVGISCTKAYARILSPDYVWWGGGRNDLALKRVCQAELPRDPVLPLCIE